MIEISRFYGNLFLNYKKIKKSLHEKSSEYPIYIVKI